MKKILLIEDDTILRQTLSEILQEEGYEVTQAKDGDEGMASFVLADYQLIITDLIMPKKGGMEVIHEIRKASWEIKIMVISGGGKHPLSEYMLMSTLLGADAVMTKPFDINQFVATVKDLLEKSLQKA
jgi:two-component system response regulator MprA